VAASEAHVRHVLRAMPGLLGRPGAAFPAAPKLLSDHGGGTWSNREIVDLVREAAGPFVSPSVHDTVFGDLLRGCVAWA
jgi:hypothetical protein